jgi:hypothetical protein
VFAPYTSVVDGSRAASTAYSYQVAAFDNAGNRSSRSTSVSATTPVCSQTALRRHGSLPGLGLTQDVAIDASLGVAAVASWDQGIHVVRLSTTTGPSRVGTLSGETRVDGISAQGGFAYALKTVYVGTSMQKELVAIDLRQGAPVVLGRLRIPGLGTGSGIAVGGNLVYVAATDAGLQVVDVSNRAAPRIVGSAAVGAASGVTTGEGWAYVNVGNGAIAIVDARTPSNPVVRSTLRLSLLSARWAADRLYVSSNQVLIFDVASPTSIRQLSTTLGYPATANEVAVAQSRALVATSTGLSVLSVAQPSAPVIVGTESPGVAIKQVDATSAGLVVTTDQAGTLTLHSTP